MTIAEAEEAIRETRQLERGWNGYTAEPPSWLARYNALAFVYAAMRQSKLPRRVAPSARGGIGVHIGDTYFEFRNDGQGCAIRTADDDDTTGEAYSMLTTCQ
jgi:hypothetical protein